MSSRSADERTYPVWTEQSGPVIANATEHAHTPDVLGHSSAGPQSDACRHVAPTTMLDRGSQNGEGGGARRLVSIRDLISEPWRLLTDEKRGMQESSTQLSPLGCFARGSCLTD